MKGLASRFLSLTIGLSAATTCVIHVLQRWTSSTWKLGLLFVALTLVFTWLCNQIALPFVRTRLRSMLKKTQRKWIALSVCAGVFLTVVFPLRPPTRHHLRIVPTGEKNPESNGREVIVIGIYPAAEPTVPVG